MSIRLLQTFSTSPRLGWVVVVHTVAPSRPEIRGSGKRPGQLMASQKYFWCHWMKSSPSLRTCSPCSNSISRKIK